ncbi:MAG: hypothetical protein AAGB12_04495 [Pseudomonadota bacterium]
MACFYNLQTDSIHYLLNHHTFGGRQNLVDNVKLVQFQFHFTVSLNEENIFLVLSDQEHCYDFSQLKSELFFEKDHYNEAIEKFKKTISLRPHLETYQDLALSYWLNGNTEKAYKSIKEGLLLSKEDFYLDQLVAEIYLTEGLVRFLLSWIPPDN